MINDLQNTTYWVVTNIKYIAMQVEQHFNPVECTEYASISTPAVFLSDTTQTVGVMPLWRTTAVVENSGIMCIMYIL